MNERAIASLAGTPAADVTPRDVASERDRALLAHRARQLARPASVPDAVEPHSSMLVFRRGNERLAIALDVVVEVLRGPDLTPLPGAAPPVTGVVPWRGRILTVIDIAPGGGRQAAGEEWRAIVIGRGRAGVVIQADVVDEAVAIAAGDHRPLDDGAEQAADTRAPIVGLTADAILVLDGEELLRRYPA